ncbi:MAG: hypothetical protein KIT60_11995 [Burkholderiaceae bacterium]|nr:hypothetical protein [Burkholderiaceae bacterium]
MDHLDHAEIVRLIREARQRDRGYASFFGWSIDRDLEELGPAKELAAALAAAGAPALNDVRVRGRGKDPPDLEAVDATGRRIAIEVTELVDEGAIRAYKAGNRYVFAEWDKSKFLAKLRGLISAKAARHSKLKDGPYPGGYVILVFSDEPILQADAVRTYLTGAVFEELGDEHRAYLLLSYSPAIKGYPYFALHREA